MITGYHVEHRVWGEADKCKVQAINTPLCFSYSESLVVSAVQGLCSLRRCVVVSNVVFFIPTKLALKEKIVLPGTVAKSSLNTGGFVQSTKTALPLPTRSYYFCFLVSVSVSVPPFRFFVFRRPPWCLHPPMNGEVFALSTSLFLFFGTLSREGFVFQLYLFFFFVQGDYTQVSWVSSFSEFNS